jgi:hypothetical protein
MMKWVEDACITHERKIIAYKILNTQDCSHITIRRIRIFVITVLFKLYILDNGCDF